MAFITAGFKRLFRTTLFVLAKMKDCRGSFVPATVLSQLLYCPYTVKH
jgi:hypothetical protein